MSKTHTRRDFSRLFGVDVLWRHRRSTSGMGLSHPPGWDNISPDVKIGGYSCLKSENNSSPEIRPGELKTPGPRHTDTIVNPLIRNILPGLHGNENKMCLWNMHAPVRETVFISSMYTELIKHFEITPRSMTLWPWLWPFTYISKTLTFAVTFGPFNVGFHKDISQCHKVIDICAFERVHKFGMHAKYEV